MPSISTSGSTIGTSPASWASARNGKRVGVCPDGVLAWPSRPDRVDPAPFGEACSEGPVFLEPLAKPVEPFCNCFSVRVREWLRALVDLDARDAPLPLEQLRERGAVRRALPDRLVEEDHPADPLLGALGGEQQIAVGTAVLLGRPDADRVEALLDRAAALVGRQDPFPRRNERPGDLVEHTVIMAPGW